MDISVNKMNASYPATATPTAAAPGTTSGAAQDSAASSVSSAATTTATSAAAAPEKAQQPKRADVEQAVKDLQQFVQSNQRNLNFSIDDSTGTVVVKVIATDSGEVVRQIPSETVLKLAQDLTSASHLLLNAKA